MPRLPRRPGRVTLIALLACALPARAEAPSEPAPEPPFLKSPHAVAQGTKTHGEGQALLARLDAKEREKLLKEGVLLSGKSEGEGVLRGVITALVLVTQPRETAFRLLIEPSQQVNYVPRLVSSKAVTRTEHAETTQFHVRVSFVDVHTRVIHRWWPEASRLAWMLDPAFKNGLMRQDGFYNVFSLDEQTSLLEFGTLLETSPLVPRFVQDHLTRSDLPAALLAVKKYLDSGGTWRR